MSIFDVLKERNLKKKGKEEENRLIADNFIDSLYKLKEENKIEKYNKKVSLFDKKINYFINWYKEVCLDDINDERIKNYYVEDLRHFIDKVAVWYELRYPEYEINRMLPSIGQQITEIDDVMFDSNDYINDNFDENSDVRLLEWNKLYNKEAFIKSLSTEEKRYFSKPEYYRDIVYYEKGKLPHFHISSTGEVLEAEYMELIKTEGCILNNEELKGKNIKEVIELFKQNDIFIPYDSEMKEVVRVYDNRVRFKDSLMDSIMYRILDRGGNRIGPRRALMFAKEFDRDVSIPMKYGVDNNSPGMRQFINEYIKAGGSKDLVCLKNFYSNKYLNEEEYDTITIGELIRDKWDNCAEKYTKEEKEIIERLVNDINMTIDHEELEKEKVKQKRIERRLNKRT